MTIPHPVEFAAAATALVALYLGALWFLFRMARWLRRLDERRSPFEMPEVLRAAQEGSRAISAALKVRGN